MSKKFQYIIPLLADWNPLKQQLKDYEGDLSKLGQTERAEVKKALQERINAIKTAAKTANASGGLTDGLADDVRELKKELKTLKDLFPADEFAKSNKTITQSFANMDEQLKTLTNTTEAFKNDIAELRQNFDGLFKSVKSGSANFGKSLDVSGVMKASLKALGKTDSEIKKATESLEDYKSALKELSGKTRIDPAIKDDVGALTAKVEELMAAEQKLSGQGKTETKEYAKTVKQMMAYEKRRIALGQSPILTINGEQLKDDFGYFQKTIEKVVQKISDEIARLEGQLDNLGDTFAKKLSEELSTINVQFSIDDKSKNALKSQINAFVQELSNGKLDKIKLKLDEAVDLPSSETFGKKTSNRDAEIIESEMKANNDKLAQLRADFEKESDKLKELKKEHEHQPRQQGVVNALQAEIESLEKANEKLESTKDSMMSHSTASIIQGFNQVSDVIDRKTKDWRRNIINALNIDKSEIKVPFSAESSAEVIFKTIQTFFEANEINLHINKEALIEELKQVVAEGGVPIGGASGTVAFSEEKMAMAIATGLQAFFTGDFTPVTGEKKVVKGVNEPRKTHTYFDPSNPFNRDVANSLSEVMKAGTQKGGQKIKEFFSMKGIDVEKMANASAGELLEMLGQLTDRFGATIADQFKQLMSDVGKNSAGSKVGSFLGDFRELLYVNRISQTTVDDKIKKEEQKKLWDNYAKKSVLDSGLGSLIGLTGKKVDISKLDAKRIPTIADIDEYIGIATGYANANGLEAINKQIEETREKIAQAEKEGKEKEAASLGRQLASLQTRQREMQSQFDYYSPIVKMLETVKEARSALIDTGDNSQKREFIDAVKKFQSTIGNIRSDLAEELNGYAWGLEIDGMKGIEDVSSTGKASRLYKGALGRDNSKVKTAHLYAAPDAQRDWLDPRPDRTAIRNRDTTIPEFKLKENTSKRWEADNAAAIEASKRATESARLVAETEKRLADGAQAESAIKAQIEELAKQRATDESTIATNEKELASIANKKEARKAKKRVETLDVELEAEKKAKEAAERQANEYKDVDYSARDAEEKAIDAEIRKLKKWQKDPEKYRENFANEIYARELEVAQKNLKNARIIEQDRINNLVSQEKQLKEQIERQEASAQRARERAQRTRAKGDENYAVLMEQDVERSKKALAELPSVVKEATKAREQAEKEIASIRAKIYGSTEEGRATFVEEAKSKLGERIQSKQAEKQLLSPNMKSEAEARSKKADAKITKLEAERAQLVETQEYKDAKRIEQLEAENQETKNRIKDGKTRVKDLKTQVKNLTPEESTQTLLGSHKEDVDDVTKDIVDLESKLRDVKEDVAKVEAYVDSVVGDKDYKKPDGTIKHTKKNQKVTDKYAEASRKTNYLERLMAGEEVPDDKISSLLKKNTELERKIKDPEKPLTSKAIEEIQREIATNREEIKRLKSEKQIQWSEVEAEAISSIRNDKTILSYIDKMGGVFKDETGQYKDPRTIFDDFEPIVKEIKSANRENQQRASAEDATDTDKKRAEWSQAFTDEVVGFLEEYRAAGVINGAGAESLFEEYWSETVNSLRENITKKSDSLKPSADASAEVVKTLQPEVEAADQHLKETYVKRIKSWFKKINEKKKIMDAGDAEGADEAAKNAAGLAVKEISDLFPLITKAMSEYKDKFGEELALAEDDAKLFEDRDKYHFKSYVGGKTSSIESEINSKRDSILNSERAKLLKTRRAELMNEIKSAVAKNEDTKALETALATVNGELEKYQKYVVILSNKSISSVFYEDEEFAQEYSAKLGEVIKLENELDLAQAKGASKSDIDQRYATINTVRADTEKTLYSRLKTKQETLLDDIKLNREEGKSVTHLVDALDLVNKELVELEINQQRTAQTSIGGDLYKASVESVNSYTSSLRDAILAQQELNKLIAEGADTKDAAKKVKSANRSVEEAINRAVNARVNGPANTDPRTQALDYLDATEDAYQTALAKVKDAERREKRYGAEVEAIRTNDRYSTSKEYKKHYNSIKSELTNDYVHSDDYKADRDDALKAVEVEFIEEISKRFGTDDNGNLSEKGQKILYEFWSNQKGKGADKLDPSKFTEKLGRLMQHGTRDPNRKDKWKNVIEEDDVLSTARKDAEDDFKNSQEYKDFVASREKVLSDALESSKAALRQAYDAASNGTETEDAELQNKFNLIDQEAAENIKFLRETTVENYPLLKEEINKILDGKTPTPKEYEEAVEKARNTLIKQEETKAIERKNVEAYSKYKAEEAEISKPIIKETNALLQDKMESYIRQYFNDWIDNAIIDGGFAGDGDAKEIGEIFKSLMEEKVYGLAGKHNQKLEVRDGFLSGANLSEEDKKRFVTDSAGNIDVQKTAEKRAEAARKIAEEDKKKAMEEVADIERKRKEAMEKGGLSRADAIDAETKKELAEFQAKITAEKARQAELTAEIVRLEKEGASVDELGAVRGQIEQTNANIDRFEKFIRNRELLIEMNRKAAEDEKKLQTYTLDEQKLFYETKRAKAEERLGSDDTKVREKAEADIARFDDILKRIATKMEAEIAKEREKNDPMNILASKFADAIKKSLGGNGGLNVDATGLATEATLTQIYEILTGIVQAMGGKVIRDPEKDAMLAELRALKAKKATAVAGENKGGNNTARNANTSKSHNKAEQSDEKQSLWKEVNDAATEEFKKAKESGLTLSEVIQNIIKDIKDPKNPEGSRDRVVKQVELQQALRAYLNENKATLDKTIDKNGKEHISYETVAKSLGIGDDHKLRMTKSQVDKLDSLVEPKITSGAVAEEVEENAEQNPPTVEVKPDVAKEDANAYVTKLQEILGGVTKDTKGKENSLKAVYDKLNTPANQKGVKPFEELRAELLKLQSGNGSIEEATKKAQEFVNIFANFGRNRFADLNKWFGKDVQADATTLLGVVKQIFEVTSNEQKVRKATKKSEEVKPAQQVAEAARAEAAATAQVTEERAEQKVIESSYTAEDARRERELEQKLGGYTGPQVDFSDADIGLAQEETLKAILNLVTKIQAEGIKKGGSTTAKKKVTKTDEATLVMQRALKDRAAIAGIGGSSKAFGEYDALAKELENKVKGMKGLKDAEKAIALNEIKTLAQKISALGFNIMKDASEWDYKLTQADKLGTLNVGEGSDVRTEMENLAKTKAGGKKYEFLDFDGTKLSYQLTDIKGNVEKVTMEWSELNNQVAITSEKSVSKMDVLAGKVETLQGKFKSALQTTIDGEDTVGYLNPNSENLKRFEEQIGKINTELAKGDEASFEKIEAMRENAIKLGAEVEKEIAKNKRLYSGTTEINAATRQYTNMKAHNILDDSGLEMVKNYTSMYDELIDKHKEFAVAGTLYDPENQKTLQNMAIKVKDLGKRLEESAADAKELQRLVDNSGTYKGQSLGSKEYTGNIDDGAFEILAKKRLQELGAEHIRFDKIHNKAIGTKRLDNKTVAELEVKYNDLAKAMFTYQKAEKESLTGVPAFLNGFKKKFNSIMQYLSMTMSIHQVIAELRKGVQYVREIDLALTELKKVTDETEKEYDQFLQTAAKTGARLGTTISAVTEATATFAKLGYSMEQATEMAESAIVYKNVGDNIASTGDAADSIISTMKGFRLEASESMAIVDRFNEVGNKFAITSQGIGEALRLSASALSEGGNSLDESIGLITAANEVVNDPSSVGTALKTLTLRLRGSKTELEEMGEDVTDMATTTSQLQAKLLALTGGQVDIMLDENTFKNSTQILREMAEAWEDMTDIQRASALELMGGKRQANTLSALIQNFDTVEKVIETSANSTGSALKENERYLDSIQGKIDQFNNAMQSVWSNIFDSDVVKSFVAWGTKIIQSLDTVHGKFLAIAKVLAIFMAYKKINPLDFIKDVSAWMNTIKDGGGLMQYVKSLLGLAPAMKVVTAETIANTVATQMNDAAKAKQMMSDMGLVGVTGTLSAVQKEQAATAILSAMSTGQLTMAQGNAMLAMLGFSGATIAADGSLKVLDTTTKGFMASNPVGWILLIVSAITMVITLISQIPSKTERLTKKLKDLKSELQDIQSELDSLNSELETTQSRMAELLAMDSLSFTEKEELDRLRKQNDELQRNIDLNEQKQKNAQRAAEKTFVQVAESMVDKDTYDYGGKRGFWDKLFDPQAQAYGQSMSADEYIDAMMVEYDKHLEYQKDQEANGYNWWTAKDPKANPEKYAGQIQDYIDQLTEAADGIDYDAANTATKEWLDYIYNLEDKWAIHQGGENAKTNAINRIFNKDENDAISKSIDGYVEALRKGDESAEKHIRGIIENNAALREDILASGLKIDDVVDYFTMSSSSTAGGIMDQYKIAITALEELKSSPFSINDLVEYDADSGEATGRITEIAEKLKGTGPEIREQFTSIIEEIKEGSYETEEGLTNWDAAIRKMELHGLQAVIANAKMELETTNKLAFPDLEVSGWIDSVSELSNAFESLSSAMDLVVTAQKQMDSSGRISLKTALDLMASTDQWNEILTVNNGVITMNANAEQILIQSKLDLIQANIDMALQEVETQIALAEGAINSTKAGNAFTNGFTKALTNAQSVLVGLKAGWDAFWAGTDVSDAFNNAFKQTVDTLTPDQASLDELYQQRAELEKKRDMVGSVDTTQKFKDYYDFEKTPGDKYDDDKGEAIDAFQKAMDYWENRIKANQARYEQLQNEIDLLESRGKIVGKEYYAEQVKIEKERLDLLVKQRAEAKSYLNNFAEGSDEWWEVAHTLNDLEGEIDGVTSSVEDLSEAMRNVDVQIFEEIVDRFSQLSDELSNIRDILSSEDMFDEEGNWTKAGIAVLGTHLQDIEMYKKGLSEVEEELDYLLDGGGEDDYSGNEQAYYDRVKELTNQQHEYTKAIHDSEQSVVDMYESNVDAVEEYTDKLVESYQDYIDNVKEALDAERDLYEFKKNVKKQTKDIAALERRIASLSGSTNAGDIAERRRLEADLYGAREELDDTYYDHAKQTQQEALDKEAEAYEETMTRFVEGMRTSLAEATVNMDSFLNSVTIAASMNADAVLEKYEETGLKLSPELTNPWVAAKNAVGEYGQEAIDLMNKWTQDGYWTDFTAKVGGNLSSPWSAGVRAANAFETSIGTVMTNVVSNIEKNVQSASTKLSNLHQQIITTEKKAQNIDTGSGGGGDGNNTHGNLENVVADKPQVEAPKVETKPLTEAQKLVPQITRFGTAQGSGMNAGNKGDNGVVEWEGESFKVQNSGITYRPGQPLYDAAVKHLKFGDRQIFGWRGGVYGHLDGVIQRLEGRTLSKSGYNKLVAYAKKKYSTFAQGTTGTKRDEWAITDEPQFGDELVLVPGKDGNLSFMRKGTGVVPADLTANLMKWGKFDPSSMNIGGGVNVNMINNAVNKPEFNLNVDNFLRCDNVSQDSLPELKQFVKEQMNSLVKQMNYSLKKSGAR